MLVASVTYLTVQTVKYVALTDWSWILSMKIDGRSIDVGRYTTLHAEFLRRMKWSYVRPSPVFPQKYTEFLYIGILHVDTHTHSNVFFKIIIFIIRNKYIISLFACSVNIPRQRVEPVGLGQWVTTMTLRWCPDDDDGKGCHMRATL